MGCFCTLLVVLFTWFWSMVLNGASYVVVG